MFKIFLKLVAIFGILVVGFSSSVSGFSATNLVANGSGETLVNNVPTSWKQVGWGNNTRSFSIVNDAADGAKSMRVDVTSWTDGDARWAFNDVAVSPNTKYNFSLFYKSNVGLQLDNDYITTSGGHVYTYIGEAPATSVWSKVNFSFITPTEAKTLNVFLPVYKVGWVQTDNYVLELAGAAGNPTPTPTPVPTPTPSTNTFARPLISIDFDDGWQSTYDNGFPLVNQYGYKATAGIITDTVQNHTPYDGYVTASEVVNLKNQGHKIASHSVTHADLTSLNSQQLRNEVVNSKTYLEGLTGQKINYFITPYCAFNEVVTAQIRGSYSIGNRNCDYPYNEKPTFDRYNINAFGVESGTTKAQIQAAVNYAKANNAWVVFIYHQVENGGGQYSVTPAQLRSHLEIIKQSGVAVLPSETAALEVSK
jgi:peptidoglycan/xylan/chitin deacetylase (PgdA/CDA1 family)